MNLLRSLCIIATLSLATMVRLMADAHVDEVAPLPDKDAFLVAIVPDLRQTLGRIESIAHGFSPKMMPGMLTAGLGMALGDPILANLGKGPVVIVVSAGSPIPNFAVLVPALDAQKYVDAAANSDLIMSKVVGNLALLAQSPDGAALGERIAANYAQMSAKPLGVDIRLSIAPDRVATAYGPFLSSMLAMQMGNMPATGLGGSANQVKKIALLEVAVLMEICSDVSVWQRDVTLSEAVLRVEDSFVAKPTSALAKALVAPVLVAKPVAARFAAGTGDLLCKGQYAVAGWSSYMNDLLGRLQKRPEGKGIEVGAITAFFNELTAFNGDIGGRIGFDDKGSMDFESALGVTDPAIALKAMEDSADITKNMSAFFGAATDLPGIPKFVLTKNVRTVDGLPVNRLSYEEDPKSAQGNQFKSLMVDREFVIGNDWLVSATSAPTLDALVAGHGPGLVLKAESIIGSGRDLYVDVNLPHLLAGFFKLTAGVNAPAMRDNPFLTALEAAPAGDPITAAWTSDDGRGRIEVRIPLAPFYKAAQAMQGTGADGAPSGHTVKPTDKNNVF
jgi:hypothetical protein